MDVLYMPTVSREILRDIKQRYMHTPDMVVGDAYSGMFTLGDLAYSELCRSAIKGAEPLDGELKKKLLQRPPPLTFENAECVHSRGVAGGMEFVHLALAYQWRHDVGEKDWRVAFPTIALFNEAALHMVERPDVCQVGWDRMENKNKELWYAAQLLQAFYESEKFMQGCLVGYAMLSEFENLNESTGLVH